MCAEGVFSIQLYLVTFPFTRSKVEKISQQSVGKWQVFQKINF